MPAPPPESDPAIVSAVGMPVVIPCHDITTLSCRTRRRFSIRSACAPASANAWTGVQVLSVVFVAVLTAAAAQLSFPLPFTPVPFTIQPMIVLVGAAALGSRLGALSQILYLMLGIAGLPVFAFSPELPQGFARLLGPTGGYLMAYPIAAFVTGLLAERGLDRHYFTSILAMSVGPVGDLRRRRAVDRARRRHRDGARHRSLSLHHRRRDQGCRGRPGSADGMEIPAALTRAALRAMRFARQVAILGIVLRVLPRLTHRRNNRAAATAACFRPPISDCSTRPIAICGSGPIRSWMRWASPTRSVVADIGAGSGWFTIRLARRVGPQGLVYAEDVQKEMINAISRRVSREGLANVRPVLGLKNDPRLPREVARRGADGRCVPRDRKSRRGAVEPGARAQAARPDRRRRFQARWHRPGPVDPKSASAPTWS